MSWAQCAASLSPTMPTTIRPMQASRRRSAEFVEQPDAEQRRADGADPGPDRVCGAERQRAECEAEQHDTEHHRRRRAERRPQAGESSVYFRPTAQPISNRPATIKASQGNAHLHCW